MNCPRDNVLLLSDKKGRLEINSCPQCNGFSVVLSQEAASFLNAQLSKKLNQAPDSQPALKKQELLGSPYTGMAMRPFSYRGIVLDYCAATHSVWFDPNEYAKIFGALGKSSCNSSSPSSTHSSGMSQRDRAAGVFDGVMGGIDVFDIVGDLVSDLVSGADVF